MFFLFFGLFHLHRLWGIVDRTAYANFWLAVMNEKDVFYYGLMGLLALFCILGVVTFFRYRKHNFWWRWIYLFGGVYVLFDLFAIATGLTFWQRLLYWMFDVNAPYWNVLWGGFVLLGMFSFILGVYLLQQRCKENRTLS